MWIGGIRLTVRTEDRAYAGTDSLVQAEVFRDGRRLITLNLDYPTEDDLERGAVRNYDYPGLPWKNDRTPPLPDGIGQDPMPYPDHGLEFSSGMGSHLKIRLRIRGDDMWIKDNVDLYVREIRQVASSFDTLAWVEDRDWAYVTSWTRDANLSTDGDEGESTWTMALT